MVLDECVCVTFTSPIGGPVGWTRRHVGREWTVQQLKPLHMHDMWGHGGSSDQLSVFGGGCMELCVLSVLF